MIRRKLSSSISSSTTLAGLTLLALIGLMGLALAPLSHSPWGAVQLFFFSLLVSMALTWPVVTPLRRREPELWIRLTG